jgi:hypothetical protein
VDRGLCRHRHLYFGERFAILAELVAGSLKFFAGISRQ